MITFFKKYLNVLRNRDVLLLWSGLLISAMGGVIREITVIWFVLQTTGSTLKTGTVLLSSLSPVFLYTISGEIADRFSRKRILLVSETIKMMLILTYPILYFMKVLSLYHFYILGFLISTCMVFSMTARSAELPNLVETGELATLNSLFRISQAVISILGAAIAGIIADLFGLYALFLSAFATLILIVLLFFVRMPGQRINGSTLSQRVFWKNLLEGWRYIFHHKVLFSLSVLSILFSLSLPLGILIPKLAAVSQMGAGGYGLLQSTKSAGNLLGSVVYGGLNLASGKSIIGSSAALGGLTFVIFVLLLQLDQPATFMAHLVLLLLFFLIGFASMFVDIPSETLWQRLAPDELRGKVLGSANTIDTLGNIPAYLLMGALADISLAAAFFAGSFLILSGSLYARFSSLWQSE
jgi:MFS family permease